MIIVEDKRLDIFKVDCQTLVCPVNKVGVMGNGLAYAFREKFDGLYPAYQRACQFGVFSSNGLFLFDHKDDKKVLCFPTKNHWKVRSPLSLIDHGLERLADNYGKMGITSIAIPGLGCGKGQRGKNNGSEPFQWSDVRSLIYEYLDPLPLKVTLIPPY
jgi:hypothetical protein